MVCFFKNLLLELPASQKVVTLKPVAFVVGRNGFMDTYFGLYNVVGY